MKKNLNKWLIIMFILIILAQVLIRVNNQICNIIGVILLPIILIVGFILIYTDKKQNR